MMSCLALRYEALVLRELKSTSYQWLQVSHIEWLTFAEQALDNGFYSVAAKTQRPRCVPWDCGVKQTNTPYGAKQTPTPGSGIGSDTICNDPHPTV
ncbi:hypothetical protein CK203_078495 [Vitis vinifera]|uniref:Uncharacterized protein n=1 Tax=Vitis vinifera TaxID=29760 RepID=A0A438FAD5_VITVI|nr:hypothetical protein CK203_078495 [Vitis vinifera]